MMKLSGRAKKAIEPLNQPQESAIEKLMNVRKINNTNKTEVNRIIDPALNRFILYPKVNPPNKKRHNAAIPIIRIINCCHGSRELKSIFAFSINPRGKNLNIFPFQSETINFRYFLQVA
ncbi:MAG: hypothetical protein JSS30_00725 [Verrucomicrobia bacterium]|nr:hypothetical protein [Verrucomicrobiota bacterium]